MINQTAIAEYLNYGVIVNSPLTKLVIAIVVLLVGFILGRVAGKVLNKVLHELELDKILKKATGIKISIEEIVSTTISYLIYFVTIVTALEIINLAPTILYILSAAALVIIIVSVILSIKDMFPNIISSIIIHQKEYMKPGDYVQIEDIKGKVKKINLLETTIETKSGDLIFVPNSVITKNKIVRYNNGNNE